MRPWYVRDDGVALITVLALLTLLLIMLGSVISLAPTLLKRANFETDLALALYAAESGLNHSLAELDGALRAEGQTLTNWLNEQGGRKTLVGDSPEISGTYTATIEAHPAISGASRVISTGAFHDRTRVISVTVRARGALFPEAVVAVNPADIFYEPNYVAAKVRVPSWNLGEVDECTVESVSNTQRIQDQPVCEIDGSFPSSGQRVVIRNSVVHIKGDLYLASEFTFENVTLYIDGGVTIKGSGSLLGTNTLNIQGGLNIHAPAAFAGEGGTLGEIAPWNYFYVKGSLSLSGNAKIGSLSPTVMPDVLFVTETLTTVIIEEDPLNGAVKCACGIYSPARNVSFNGNAFRMYGAVVGNTFNFNPQSGYQNIEYDAYAERMQNVDLPHASRVVPSDWTEE